MNELIINYGISKTKKFANIAFGIYFTIFSLYFLINELMATPSRHGVLFFCALIGALIGIVMILGVTMFTSKPLLKIDNTAIQPGIALDKNQTLIEWANVSEMNIGVSYIIFIINGQKQQKLDLSPLLYKDMVTVKSKAIEICEFKNIPYKND
jgi:hypothetical protein